MLARLRIPRGITNRLIVAVAAWTFGAPPVLADTVTLNKTQGTSQSWVTAVDWTPNGAPTSGNDYLVPSSFLLRTQNIGTTDIFGGDSLTMEAGTTLALKGTAAHTITVNDLRLNGATVAHFGGDFAFTLSGNITLGDSTTNTLNSSTPAGRLLDVTAAVSGSGNIAISGNQVTLSANNTYSGATTINSNAMLQVGNGGTAGSIANTSGITNNGALVYNRSNDLSVSYAIGGTGSLTKLGAGTLTLSNTNTYSGDTSIGNNTTNVGTVNVTASGALGSGQVTVVSNTSSGNLAQLTLNSGSGITLANDFETSGTGPGSAGIILNQSGDNEFSGTIALIGGGGNTNIFSDGGSLTLSGGVTVNYTSGRTVQLGGTAGGTVSGLMADGNNPLSVTKTGTGTWEITNTNTYTGATTINGGTLLISGSGSINTASGVTVGDGGTLLYDSSVALTAPLTMSANSTVGGTGAISGNLVFNSGSSLYVENLGNPLDVGGTASFASTFGIANLSGITWGSVNAGTYTLIAGTVDPTNLINVGSGDPYDVGGGKTAYFEIGSLDLVVVPEPASLALVGLGGAMIVSCALRVRHSTTGACPPIMAPARCRR